MLQFAINNDPTVIDDAVRKYHSNIFPNSEINSFPHKIDAMGYLASIVHKTNLASLFKKSELIKIDKNGKIKISATNEEIVKDINETLCYKYAAKGNNFLLMNDICKGRKIESPVYVTGIVEKISIDMTKNTINKIKKEANVKLVLKVTRTDLIDNVMVHMKFRCMNDYAFWKLKNNVVSNLKVSDKEKTKKLVEREF